MISAGVSPALNIGPEELAGPEAPIGESGRRQTQALRTSGRAARLVIVAALTLIAAWLRYTSIGFGLPDRFRPDEEYLVSRALGFKDDWNPHFAIYPAAQMYVAHGALKYYAELIGYRQDFRAAYASDSQALAFLVIRRVSAALGTATVSAIYFAAVPIFGPEAAVGAAAITTFSTLPVRESKYATTDAATMFWVTLALAAILRIAKRGYTLDYLSAGFLSGVATATKYPAGAVVFALAAAHLGICRKERRSFGRTIGDLKIYLSAGAAALTFFCATPYLFLDWAQTVGDFIYQRGFELGGVGNPLADYGWAWLLERAMPDSFGIALMIFLIAAMFWGLIRARTGTLSLLAFLAVALIGMTRSHYVFYRYLVVPFPALALLGGAMFADLMGLAAKRIGKRRAIALATLGLGALIAPSFVRDVELNYLLKQTDTRTLAREWIAAHVPVGGAIAATDSSTPYGKPQLSGIRVQPFEPPQQLRREGIQYVISDSIAPLAFYSRGPLLKEMALLNSNAVLVFDINPLRPGAPAPVFDAADAFYTPIRHITSMTRPGPRIRIWKLK
jgi:hypothetical protein